MRKKDIDLIKTIAIFCVAVIHACGNGFYRPVSSPDWMISLFWGVITRAGVPLFFMCSGALMLNPAKELPIKKLFGKYIPRFLLALFFWAAVYGIVRLSLSHTISLSALLTLAKNLVLFRHEQHLYFLHIILLVYAVLPVIRILTKFASKQQIQYALLVWLILGILYPTLLPYFPFSRLRGIPLQWGINLTWSSIGYCLLGWYMQKYAKRKRPLFCVLFILGACVTFFGTWFLSVRNGKLDGHLLDGNTIGVCMMAIGLFGLCMDAQPGKWAVFFSKASFCIYLSHMLVMIFLVQIACPLLLHSGYIPIVAAIAAAFGSILYLLLRELPFVKDWLI